MLTMTGVKIKYAVRGNIFLGKMNIKIAENNPMIK